MPYSVKVNFSYIERIVKFACHVCQNDIDCDWCDCEGGWPVDVWILYFSQSGNHCCELWLLWISRFLVFK